MYLVDVTPPMVSWTMEESESAIREYYLGIGSSPKSDGIFSFAKLSQHYLNGSQHSAYLAELDFNFTHGLEFYVTVVGVNVLGLETSMTSPQVIVDWSWPAPSVVRDGNGTSDVDFQLDTDHVSATWSEFLDSESSVVEYLYCVGTRPDSCDVSNQTSVNVDLHATTQLNLEHGQTYFVTVTAINGAGLSTTSSSNGVTIDTTPPIIEGFSPSSVVTINHNTTSNITGILTTSYKVTATWDAVFDLESEVKDVSLCATTSKDDCSLLPWKSVSPSSSSISLDFSNPLQTGTMFILKVKVGNGAGLETIGYSGNILVDSSPPKRGTVKIGGKLKELVFLQEGQSFRASWLGFVDSESGIKMYEWKICSASRVLECVSDFVNVDLKTSLVVNDLGIEHGREYNVLVRAVNFAGLEVTAVSNVFVLDKTPPGAGMVFDGDVYLTDRVYHSSGADISVSWKGFQDRESGIARYEVCVGASPGLCDVAGFQSYGMKTTATVSNLNLTHHETYYTSIRAVNGAAQTSIATSNGLFIDLTSPVGGGLRDGEGTDIDVTLYGSYVGSNWDEFHDPESGVLKYVICSGTVRGGCDVLPLTTVDSGFAMMMQVNPVLSSGTVVYSTLRVYNKAGGVTEVYSDGVMVDSTPPNDGKIEVTSPSILIKDTIYLTSKTSICSTWEIFIDSETDILDYRFSLCVEHNEHDCPITARDLNNRTSICIEEPPITEGERYFIKITATNQVGLSSSVVSPTFVVDTTEPDVGEITASNPFGDQYRFVSTAILANWRGFIDFETGISGYVACIGTAPALCDVTESVSVGNGSNYTWHDLSLVHDEEYFVSIKSLNNAAISTNFTASSPVAVDTTAPSRSEIIDGLDNTRDMDYQRSRTRVSASWFSVEDPESDVITLTWCVGSRPRSCDLRANSSLGVTATKISNYLDEPLENGDRYYVTVQSTNGAGLVSVIVSDGVTVDFTPPSGGVVIDGQYNDVDYLKDGDTVYARWSGFEDVESGIKSYQFALCEKDNVTACPAAFSNTGLQTNISLTGTELRNGIKYVVTVRATNMVGLSRDVTSDGFTVDATEPLLGRVLIVSPSPSSFDIHQVTARWENFMDAESDISEYEVCLGNSQEECDENDFQSVGLNTSHTFTGLKLRHQELYYVTVRASNNARLSTEVTSDEINVDVSPPHPAKEMSGSSVDLEDVCINVVSDRSCNKTTSETKSKVPLKISCAKDLVKASWLKHEDGESGIAKVEWCVETVHDSCNLHPWEALPTTLLTKSAVIHLLSSVFAIRVAVRITNGVGNRAMLKSESCNPVKTFPPKLSVSEVENLTLTDIDYQTDTEAIVVKWLSPSNVSAYSSVQVALTEPNQELNASESLLENWRGEPFAFEFVDIPRGKSHIRFSGDRIKPYTKYRSVVRYCNEFGLCRDSVGDGVVITPDAPTVLEVNATDTFVGTEQRRWQKYVDIPLSPRGVVEETYFIPDPFSVLIEANLENTAAEEELGVTYEASVYRVTSGENETRNETIDVLHIFEHSHIHDEFNVCCEKTSNKPRTVYPDQQIKPVQEMNAFGASVAALNDDLILASSQDSAYVFPTGSLESMPLTLVTFNASRNGSFVKVKGVNDIALVSGDGKLLLYRINVQNLTPTNQILTLTNCNRTMTATAEHCTGNDRWSSSESVGKEFVYDGSEIIAVSGRHPTQGYGVVAIFRNESTSWRLHQVLGSEEKEQSFGSVITMNNHLLVVVGSGVHAYSRVFDSHWSKSTVLSEALSSQISNANNVYLTERNELVVLSVPDRTLVVFKLSPVNATSRCRYEVSGLVQLSGSLHVVEGNTSLAAIGIMFEGQDGSELVIYEPGSNCVQLGRVVTKSGPRFDDGLVRANVFISKQHLVLGTPGLRTWPSDHMNSGTGRVYVTSLCPRNFVRRMEFEFGYRERVTCVPCSVGEEAYPGFEERCVNCSRSICLADSDQLNFRVSHCDRYPCGVLEDRVITQNVSQDNLTVTESAPSLVENAFYLPSSKQSYFIRIAQVSLSGLTTISDSFRFSLDNTSPEAGSVFDGLGSDDSRNCSANTTFSSEHQCSSRSFSETDLDFTNNTAEISARWLDFRDNESDIEHYYWCIGSKPLSDDVMRCENATSHLNRTLTGLSLQHNDTYFVTVLVCNYAGLCTARSSDGVLVDVTPPVIHYVRDGLIGPDIDFQVFTNIIFGNWAAEDPESGVVSYEIGWGLSPGLDDVVEFQEIGNASAYYAKFKNGNLVKGSKYYVTVKAINAAGLESEPVTSNGIVVGKTEFLFSKNDSGSFFFDTVNVDTNETMEDSGVGNTFGTLDVPSGAVEDEVKFQVYSVGGKEYENGTDDNTTVVDPQVMKPPKHFKLGNYSFQIKAYEPENNTLQSKFYFNKPITISLFYDVDQMLEGNKKVVSKDVTSEDIDPVLLLWDTENQTWFDAAKTCPEPWTFVDHAAKLLKVHVCHLTQFALFWTFEAENGIIEFHKETNGSLSHGPPHAVYEEDNSIIYNPERYGDEITLDVVRRKGSTGTINVTWVASSQSNTRIPFRVSPSTGQLSFIEGQWEASIDLKFGALPSTMSESVLVVEFLNVSGGAMLGNLRRVKIVFQENIVDSKESRGVLVVVLPCVFGVLFILGMIAAVVCIRKRRRNPKPTQSSFERKDNPTYGQIRDTRFRRQSKDIAETSFS